MSEELEKKVKIMMELYDSFIQNGVKWIPYLDGQLYTGTICLGSNGNNICVILSHLNQYLSNNRDIVKKWIRDCIICNECIDCENYKRYNNQISLNHIICRGELKKLINKFLDSVKPVY
jgi:6-phosphogluconate dehydrogenase